VARQLRYSKELPPDVKRIDPRQWQHLQRRLDSVRMQFPEMVLVGGTALRLWREIRDMPVPEETASPDIDILQPGLRGYKKYNSPETGSVDVYPTLEAIEPPRFTTINHNFRPLDITTPAHLLVHYGGTIIDHTARQLDIKKHVNYYRIARNMVTSGEIEVYSCVVASHYGYHILDLLKQADQHLPYSALRGKSAPIDGQISDDHMRARLLDLGLPHYRLDWTVANIPPDKRASFFKSEIDGLLDEVAASAGELPPDYNY